MASVITIAGEQLFAAKAQANEQLDIDTFIFANVPNQDPNAPINREEGIPTAHIVYQQNVQQVGRINDNVVVYSTVLDSITGPFEFNWVGLYSSVNQKLVAINHVPTVTKTATAPGAAGNTLNRNFGIEYSGIAELTGITVDAGTWQIDYTARLSGMDLLTQQLATDMNGKDWFIEDGLKVVPRATANTFSVTPGVGYVSGLRVELKQEHILIVQSYPQFVYVDAWFSGNANSTWSPQLAFTVTNTEMDDYIDPSGTQHYVYKLAVINAADDVEDLRKDNEILKKQESYEIYDVNFKTILDLKNRVNSSGRKIDFNKLVGSKVFWRGYHSESDGGSNWGIVNRGEHIEDGGIIFSISNDIYVRANMPKCHANIKKWGGKDGGFDNSQIIKNCLQFLKHTGGKLSLGYGTYETNGIDLSGFSNITIKGENESSQFPYILQTCIKINNICDAAINLIEHEADDESGQVVETQGSGIKLKNIIIDGNRKALDGVVARLAATLDNVTIRNCLRDGIVLADGSYPVYIKNSLSQHNGGVGCKIKAPNTTVYRIKDSEFGFNEDYGLYIEDGSTCIIDCVLLQSNKRGGLKIVQNNKDLYEDPIFLERLTFIALYTEANGTLDESDLNYDGNFALKIKGFNDDPNTFSGKINDLTFINCSINKSSKGKLSSISATNGLVSINSTGIIEGIDETNIISSLNSQRGKFTFKLGQNNGPDFYQYGESIAFYEKTGNLVTCFFKYSWIDKNGADDNFFCFAKTLPFIPRSDGIFKIIQPISLSVNGGTTDRLDIVIESSSLLPTFIKNGNSDSYVKCADLPSSGTISGSFSYLTGYI